MKAIALSVVFLTLTCLSGCHKAQGETPEPEQQKVIVTSPTAKDVVFTRRYVCQIHSQRHINVRALQNGYLKEITIKEGQSVKQGEVLFRILPTLYQARLDAEVAEAQLAQIEFDNTKGLYDKGVVALPEVKLAQAKLDKARAKANLAAAELNFTTVIAPFDGIVDRQHEQLGSLIKEGDILTTLSDNSVMWVYFNVPEAQYLEYKHAQNKTTKVHSQQLKLPHSRIELRLADGNKFKYDAGDTVTVEGKFNNQTGNIPFRADFPNPDGVLRHGQTGTVLIHRTLHNAIVIPQRATFEILDKRYVFVVDKDHIAHQRQITIQHEQDDIFIIKSGLDVNDMIILEGGRQITDGDHVEYEFRKPEDTLANQKNHAE